MHKHSNLSQVLESNVMWTWALTQGPNFLENGSALKWNESFLVMDVKQHLHCVANLGHTYHQGHNCESHSWNENPHPKKRNITWLTASFLQPLLIVHLFSLRLQHVELIKKWNTDDLTQSDVWTVSCSERWKSYLSPVGSRTVNLISFPSIWLICERTK